MRVFLLNMTELTPNIIAYHTNYDFKCNHFIKTKTPIISEDTYWLGDGMYFWDNLSNAKFWVNKKKKDYRRNSLINL